MGVLRKGDVVVYPFPYTDLTSRKLRPCLVCSNEMGEDVLLCQITSREIGRDRFAVPITADMSSGSLFRHDSYVRVNMLFTASTHQIVRRIGRISDDEYAQVVRLIVQMIRKH